MLTREVLEQCFQYKLSNKKEELHKNKKNKVKFVLEKMKQICAMNKSKAFTKDEIINSCENFEFICDIDAIIDNLNLNGHLIKLNSNNYQLC